MKWPSPQDYREAIQDPANCLADPELQQASLGLDLLQLPSVQSGQYASVFKLHLNGKSWAVRCFLQNFSDREERYRKISQFILNDKLEYTVGFELIEKGIRVGTHWFPILKMEYVEGESLGFYLRKNCNNADKLSKLKADFVQMMAEFKDNGIAHGDLQHDNIIVNPEGRLRLIDYDGMFVPALMGKQSHELGHRNYQHPARNFAHFGKHLDNFSAWLILGAIDCLITAPMAWNEADLSDEALLLRREDFLFPETSPAFFALENNAARFQKFSKEIRTLLTMSPESLPDLDVDLTIADLKPVAMPKIENSSIAKYKRNTILKESFEITQALTVEENPALVVPVKTTQLEIAKRPNDFDFRQPVLEEIRSRRTAGEPIVWNAMCTYKSQTSGPNRDLASLKISILFGLGTLSLVSAIVFLLFPTAVTGSIIAILLGLELAYVLVMPYIRNTAKATANLAQRDYAATSLESESISTASAVYAMSERNFYICRELSKTDKENESTWVVDVKEIPLSQIELALIYNQDDVTDQMQLIIRPVSRSKNKNPSYLTLRGLSRAQRAELKSHFKRRWIVCREYSN